MSEGISYNQILHEHDSQHGFGKKKSAKHKALLTGKSMKQQMRFTRQNREYQKRIGRAWND